MRLPRLKPQSNVYIKDRGPLYRALARIVSRLRGSDGYLVRLTDLRVVTALDVDPA